MKPPSLRGTRWKSVNWPADRSRLVVADDGLELGEGDNARTVRVGGIVAMLSHENGYRHVLEASGYGIGVNPHAWQDGFGAVAKLDHVVPAALQLPMPAIDGLGPAQRLGVWKRWTGGVGQRLRRGGDRVSASRTFWVLCAILLSVLAVAALAAASLFPAVLLGFGVVTIVRGLLSSADP